MIRYILGLLLFFRFSDNTPGKNDCNSGCHISVSDSLKYAFVEDRYKNHKHTGEGAYAPQTCYQHIKSKQTDFTITLSVYDPEFDDSRLKIADTSFVHSLSDKMIQFYHHRTNFIGYWFVVISSKTCNKKWRMWINKDEIAPAEEILSGIKMTQDE